MKLFELNSSKTNPAQNDRNLKILLPFFSSHYKNGMRNPLAIKMLYYFHFLKKIFNACVTLNINRLMIVTWASQQSSRALF